MAQCAAVAPYRTFSESAALMDEAKPAASVPSVALTAIHPSDGSCSATADGVPLVRMPRLLLFLLFLHRRICLDGNLPHVRLRAPVRDSRRGSRGGGGL